MTGNLNLIKILGDDADLSGNDKMAIMDAFRDKKTVVKAVKLVHSVTFRNNIDPHTHEVTGKQRSSSNSIERGALRLSEVEKRQVDGKFAELLAEVRAAFTHPNEISEREEIARNKVLSILEVERWKQFLKTTLDEKSVLKYEGRRVEIVSYGVPSNTKIYVDGKELTNIKTLNISISSSEPKVITVKMELFDI